MNQHWVKTSEEQDKIIRIAAHALPPFSAGSFAGLSKSEFTYAYLFSASGLAAQLLAGGSSLGCQSGPDKAADIAGIARESQRGCAQQVDFPSLVFTET